MAFKNRIRLPFYLTRPQFPDERNIFHFADGTSRVLMLALRKVYEGLTDHWPEWVHQRLKVALSHDLVNIEGERYLGGVVLENDYEIDWQEFMDYPYAQAKFRVQVTPFDYTNSNCQTCDEATQLDLRDNQFGEVLDQNSGYLLDVFANDTINCYPITVTITYTNPVFIDSASIDPETGILTIQTKPIFYQRSTVKLLTYRVTCPNGNWDEADVFANLTGDASACATPASLVATTVTEDGATLDWTEPSTGVPDDGYEWQYAEAASPATIIETGTTTGLTLTIPTDVTILDPSTEYIFSVRAVCDSGGGITSEWVNVNFTTDSQSELCGRYSVVAEGGFTTRPITYLTCAGTYKTIHVRPFKVRQICTVQNSPGVPVSIIGATTIIYISQC